MIQEEKAKLLWNFLRLRMLQQLFLVMAVPSLAAFSEAGVRKTLLIWQLIGFEWMFKLPSSVVAWHTSMMIVLTVAWQFSKVAFISKVKDGLVELKNIESIADVA